MSLSPLQKQSPRPRRFSRRRALQTTLLLTISPLVDLATPSKANPLAAVRVGPLLLRFVGEVAMSIVSGVVADFITTQSGRALEHLRNGQRQAQDAGYHTPIDDRVYRLPSHNGQATTAYVLEHDDGFDACCVIHSGNHFATSCLLSGPLAAAVAMISELLPSILAMRPDMPFTISELVLPLGNLPYTPSPQRFRTGFVQSYPTLAGRVEVAYTLLFDHGTIGAGEVMIWLYEANELFVMDKYRLDWHVL